MEVVDRRFVLASALSMAGPAAGAAAQREVAGPQTFTYATAEDAPLALDLYRPTEASKPLPVILFLHGGAWMFGYRTTAPDLRRYFAQSGFAMASIDYRLTPKITFPSNLEDVRTAIRWLRGNAGALGLDAGRIGLWGTSAGGHLASLAGLAPPGLYEGAQHPGLSSQVSCVLDAYGPTALELQAQQLAAEKPGLDALPPAVAAIPSPTQGLRPLIDPNTALLGAPVESVPEKARAANPITYVQADAPPFLIMHGLADGMVPHGQSVLLYEALARAGAEATLRLVHGLPHTFFNMPGIDDAGPFAMEVRRHQRGQAEARGVEHAKVFDVAREFFMRHLM